MTGLALSAAPWVGRLALVLAIIGIAYGWEYVTGDTRRANREKRNNRAA